MFSKQLNQKLDKYNLLHHPLYKSWNDGKLTREIIKDYAEQYYQHVKAFPRYISATHSLCEDIEKRKILLENLQDEENRDGDHPKLWKDFAFAIGSTSEQIESVKEEKFTTELIENFFILSKSVLYIFSSNTSCVLPYLSRMSIKTIFDIILTI